MRWITAQAHLTDFKVYKFELISNATKEQNSEVLNARVLQDVEVIPII